MIPTKMSSQSSWSSFGSICCWTRLLVVIGAARALNWLLASISLCDLVRALVALCCLIDFIHKDVANVVAVVKTRTVLILVTYASQQVDLRKKNPLRFKRGVDHSKF